MSPGPSAVSSGSPGRVTSPAPASGLKEISAPGDAAWLAPVLVFAGFGPPVRDPAAHRPYLGERRGRRDRTLDHHERIGWRRRSDSSTQPIRPQRIRSWTCPSSFALSTFRVP